MLKMLESRKTWERPLYFAMQGGRRHLVLLIPNKTVQRSQGADQGRVKPDVGHGRPVVPARTIRRHSDLAQQAAEKKNRRLASQSYSPAAIKRSSGLCRSKYSMEQRRKAVVHHHDVGIRLPHASHHHLESFQHQTLARPSSYPWARPPTAGAVRNRNRISPSPACSAPRISLARARRTFSTSGWVKSRM